jgi:hypothetical protein
MRITATQPLFAWAAMEDSPSLETIRRYLEAVPEGAPAAGAEIRAGAGP